MRPDLKNYQCLLTSISLDVKSILGLISKGDFPLVPQRSSQSSRTDAPLRRNSIPNTAGNSDHPVSDHDFSDTIMLLDAHNTVPVKTDVPGEDPQGPISKL